MIGSMKKHTLKLFSAPAKNLALGVFFSSFLVTACIPRSSKTGANLADTGYINPNGTEVEMDIEADVTAPSLDKIMVAPSYLGQFALTYMAKNYHIYLESIVTDASSPKRVEWLVNGAWLNYTQVSAISPDKLNHFRIRGMDAVLLRDAQKNVVVGTKWLAKVPMNPLTVAEQAGGVCADPDEEDYWQPDDNHYWYLWNPNKPTCNIKMQSMTLTVSKTFSTHATYPDYDKLLADGKITVVVFFTALGDFPPLDPKDDGIKSAAKAANILRGNGFTEVANAPLGRRFSRSVGKTVLEVDIYSPNEFAGLGDEAHFANFQKAISEHEIIMFDGHSKLGASDFWGKAKYPSFYQIIVYGGCLGYQYYVRPIVQNKGGWSNLDIVSSVFEVGATAIDIGVPFLKDLLLVVEGKQPASWQQILTDIKTSVEATESDEPSYLPDTSFGVSGARDNCWAPNGSTCK